MRLVAVVVAVVVAGGYVPIPWLLSHGAVLTLRFYNSLYQKTPELREWGGLYSAGKDMESSFSLHSQADIMVSHSNVINLYSPLA
jgi:hemoglobin-like flavoprotein